MTPGEILLRLFRIQGEINRMMQLKPTNWGRVRDLAEEARQLEEQLKNLETQIDPHA